MVDGFSRKLAAHAAVSGMWQLAPAGSAKSAAGGRIAFTHVKPVVGAVWEAGADDEKAVLARLVISREIAFHNLPDGEEVGGDAISRPMITDPVGYRRC